MTPGQSAGLTIRPIDAQLVPGRPLPVAMKKICRSEVVAVFLEMNDQFECCHGVAKDPMIGLDNCRAPP